MNLEQFLDNKLRNSWLDEGVLSVYVRKGIHYINGNNTDTFDIANVVVEEEHQKQGVFTKFIERVEKAITLPIYVENIHHSWLVDFFSRRGYNIIDIGGLKSAIKR